MTEEVRQALRICPPGLRQAIDRLPDAGAMEELRLRCGQPPACRIAGKERALPLAPVTPELLRGMLEQATQRSAYAMQEMTRCGFVTLPGGHRLGICGTAVVQNGTITALREPSSLNLRIARQPDGIADRLRDALWARPQSVLLCGAPGSGKTTLLRDLIRQLSDRFGWRICVVDERLELAACASGVPQFRLGAAEGLQMARRAVIPHPGRDAEAAACQQHQRAPEHSKHGPAPFRCARNDPAAERPPCEKSRPAAARGTAGGSPAREIGRAHV